MGGYLRSRLASPPSVVTGSERRMDNMQQETPVDRRRFSPAALWI